MSLGQLATAVRVREVIKRQAVDQIDKNIPRPLVGRVISVDLPRQKARVWFTGDEQPIEATLFSSTVPGKWQAQLQPGLTASTNTVGYGSMVSCQRLNGTLYITDVLTGGQFSYDLSTMNQKFIATYPYVGGAASVFGQVIAAKMHVTLTTDITVGQSLEFGPFTQTGDSSYANWVKIEINSSIGNTIYEFSLSGSQFYDSSVFTNRWFRILPKHESSANTSSQKDYYDLDICFKQTSYGIEPDFNTQSNEVWFRLIPRNSDVSFLFGNVSIETSMFDHPRSTDGNERLIQNLVAIPPDIKGYIGFHNSEMNVFDLSDLKIRDHFDRTTTTDWSTASDGTTWTGSGGTSSNYLVSGSKGQILSTATATTYSQVNSRLEYDFDCLVKVSPSLVAVGAIHSAYVFLRRTASNNYYRFAVDFTTASQTNISIAKNVAGSITSLTSTASVVAYSANSSFWIRAQIRNSKLRMKFWASSAVEPTAWNLTVASDTSITGAGALALAADRTTSNTNSALVTSFSELECNLSMQARFSSASWTTGPWRAGVLRTENDLQKTWTCTSGFTWDNTNNALGWTGEILFSGIGRHRNALSQGSMYLTCPKNVTEYVIPVFGNSSPTTIAVHANGVVLAAGRSLYVSIPPGERNVDLIENLFLVDSSVDGVDFQLPEWAVLIAHRQLGTSLIRLGNGEWAGAEAVEVITTDSGTTANQSYTAGDGFSGSTVCGGTFIAPQSGKVNFTWSAEISSTATFTLLSIEVRDGSTIGSGTVIFGPDDNYTARNDGASAVGCFAQKMITGLVPGMPYNVRTMHRRGSSNNGSLGRRKIWINPAA